MARRAVEQCLGEAARPADIYLAQLLVSELVTNSLHHGNLSPDDSIELSVEVDGDSGVVKVEVSDPGPGFAPDPAAAELSAVGGRGLHLVQQVARRWGVKRGRATVVWFELQLGRTAGRPEGDGSPLIPNRSTV